MPLQLVNERVFTRAINRSPFVQRASWFQDIVIRCVRYAFAYVPASVGRVFFSKYVALPFIRFRMLRHLYFKSPIQWQEMRNENMTGLWLTTDPVIPPDIVVYYCHGGGFSMGSSYFYLEFLLAWVSLLRESGYRSPALFALEYTLVPDAVHPVQLRETVAGYDFVTSRVQDPSRICVAGDSAGATLQLSLLLLLAENADYRSRLPGFAVMISPWVTLVSEKNRDTQSDYLNAASLHCYAQQYAGGNISVHDPLISPGDCKSIELWEKVSLRHGIFFIYGAVEVFAAETRDLVAMLRKAGQEVIVHEERGAVHAWPVVSLFLGSTKAERLKGLRSTVSVMRHRMRCE